MLVQPNGGIVARLPEPTKAEYAAKEEEPVIPVSAPIIVPTAPDQTPVSPKPALTMSDAIEAIRSEDYEPAIDFFSTLTQQRSNYHIGWLRLGYARREWAVRRAPDDRPSAIALLKSAVNDLNKATQHVDAEYQALAWYERSKAWHHLARLEPESGQNRKNCLEDAEKAFALSDEKKFLTWLEHVQTLPN